jgi:hypothetical protein
LPVYFRTYFYTLFRPLSRRSSWPVAPPNIMGTHRNIFLTIKTNCTTATTSPLTLLLYLFGRANIELKCCGTALPFLLDAYRRRLGSHEAFGYYQYPRLLLYWLPRLCRNLTTRSATPTGLPRS